MAEPLDWLDDGTPYSPRFGDRYHSEQGGLAQAREVFLHGCGLPAAWAHQPQWRILETGFGFGLNFLTTWAAWRADPQRPRLLHFVSLEAWPVAADDLLRATRVHPALAPLAQELHRHYWGLLPGIHRIALDGGQVLLTLCIGDAQTLLRQQDWTVDSVYLDGFSPQRNPEVWSLHTLKAVARCCRRGTRLATWTVARAVRDDLAQCGFTVAKVPGVPPKRDNLHATFDPRWEPRQAQVASAAHTASAAPGATPAPGASATPGTGTPACCIVIGAGLAGAAAAASLARRGWQVQVLDQGDAPAAGASGLPAGVFAPHVSVDDSVVSRLSRSGVRATLQAAAQYLQEGTDWQPSGVLQHHVDGKRGLPTDWDAGPGADWSHAAPDVVRAALGIAPGVGATWHRRGGWIRPARLVQALLAQPGVQFHGGQAVARLVRVANSSADLWQALDAQGRVLASAPLVVVATGFGSPQLLAQTDPALARWPLGIVRGQVTGARQADLPWPGPAFPVNGHGNAVPAFFWPDPAPAQTGAAPAAAAAEVSWIAGSTFERGPASVWPPAAPEQAAAHHHNLGKLQALLPGSALPWTPLPTPAPAQPPGQEQPPAQEPAPHPAPADAAPLPPRLRHWAGIRCASPDRLPLVGPVDAQALPGLWVSTAMGARGLTLALLCGELLAARLHGEPLPLDSKLAQALDTARMDKPARGDTAAPAKNRGQIGL